MAKQPYRVDYHVMGVSYFAAGLELSGPELARLWSGTRIFGQHKVTGAFWHEGSVPKIDSQFELGALEQLQPLLDIGTHPIFGGGVSVNSRSVARNVIVDRDFYYAHSPAFRNFGYDTDSSLLYTMSGQWFERVGAEIVLNHMREHFEAADSAGSPYGLIDVSSSDDCYGGAVYDSGWVDNIPLHRWVEHVKWLSSRSQRQQQARGVYWGNYFGPAILDRLGGRERFLTRFRQQAQYPDGRASARIWEFNNGVFVSLCLDPLGCKPGQPLDGWAAHNMHWLVLELGSHGVLNPWAGEQPAEG